MSWPTGLGHGKWTTGFRAISRINRRIPEFCPIWKVPGSRFTYKILCRIPVRADVILVKMSETDLDLLARYCRGNAEDAFAEVVHRHLDLVHSAALRQVRSPQLAEEVAQTTFLKLARHAHQLAP